MTLTLFDLWVAIVSLGALVGLLLDAGIDGALDRFRIRSRMRPPAYRDVGNRRRAPSSSRAASSEN